MKASNLPAACGLALAALLLGAPALAADPPPLPPPDIDAPGVAPAPATPGLRDDIVPHDEPAPEVRIRSQDGDVIQEYSRGGRVYMITVIPESGVKQTYRDIDGDGRLDLEPGQPPVKPVYYTIYEWGKPAKRD